MSNEVMNYKTICFACQRKTIKAKYKRIYAKRRERESER